MNALIKRPNGVANFLRDPNMFFGRGIDDILKYDFFSSLDANMREDRNGFILEVAVPGMTRKDITLQVQGSMMTVTAQKQQRNDRWKTVEFNSSVFQRSFALPKDADTHAIEAKCRDGILTIRIGRTKGSHRVVKIQGEEISKDLSANVTFWWHGIKTRLADFLKQKGLKKSDKN